jgi:hypothetical protein
MLVYREDAADTNDVDNRFSQDMNLIDDELPSSVLNLGASKNPYAKLQLVYLHVLRCFQLYRTSHSDRNSNILHCTGLPVHCGGILFHPEVLFTNLETAAFHGPRG